MSEIKICRKCNQQNKIEKNKLVCYKCKYIHSKEKKNKTDTEATLNEPRVRESVSTRQCATCEKRKDIETFFKNKREDCDECYIEKYREATLNQAEPSQRAKDLYQIVKALKMEQRRDPKEETLEKIKEAEKECRRQYEKDHKERRSLKVPKFCSCGEDFSKHPLVNHFFYNMKGHLQGLEKMNRVTNVGESENATV